MRTKDAINCGGLAVLSQLEAAAGAHFYASRPAEHMMPAGESGKPRYVRLYYEPQDIDGLCAELRAKVTIG